MTPSVYRQVYEFFRLHSVVGLDRNTGLHRLRHYYPSLRCGTSVCDTPFNFVCNHGLDVKPIRFVCSN